VAIQQHNTSSIISAPSYQRRGQQHFTESDDTAKVMQRHLQFLLALDIHAHRLTFKAEIGIRVVTNSVFNNCLTSPPLA
jgi:hypothetical protein